MSRVAPENPVKMRCKKCGSDDTISREAVVHWSVENQDWEITSILDEDNCDDCGEDVGVEVVPV